MLKKFVSIASVLALSVAFVGCEAAAEKAKDGAATTPAAATTTTEEHTEVHTETPAAVTPAPEAAK